MAALKFKDVSDLVAKWISIIAAILGGFIWLNTYVVSKRNETTGRQQESIKFVREYNSPDTLKLRQDYFGVKQATHNDVDEKIASLGSSDAALSEAERLIRSTALKITLNNNKGLEMRRLIEIFDQIAACVDINVCDKQVVYRFFNAEAYDIRYVLMDFINQVKRTRPDFGRGIEALSYKPKD
jgi:hypothetical protein